MSDEEPFWVWGHECMQCGKTKEQAGHAMLRCGRCRSAAYCGQDCQRAAFDHHKRYCKRMIYTSMAQLKETNESRRKVDQGHPLLVAAREALEDEPADRQAQFIKVAANLAENLYRALLDDILTSQEEEGLWGLRGEPSSPEYQRVYSAFQSAAKGSDLTATMLFEALTAVPSASAALTRLLKSGVRMVCTEEDDPEIIERFVERHIAMTDGLAVDSDVDRLPLRPRA